MNKLRAFWNDQSGAQAIEYALIAGTTALVLVAVLPLMQSSLDGQFSSVADAM